jgi:HPt (histidine-containing phosphotransfer) domain-containing protein
MGGPVLVSAQGGGSSTLCGRPDPSDAKLLLTHPGANLHHPASTSTGGATMPSNPNVLDPSAIERLQRIGGDRLVVRMLATFDAFATEKVREIEAACRDQRWEDAGLAAHALKSSAGNVGATALQRLALEVEQAGRSADADAVPTLALALIRAFEEAQIQLAALESPGELS